MTESIYWTFFRKHIDLDKIVSISDAKFCSISENNFWVEFEIQFQLVDTPMVHRHELTYDEVRFSSKSQPIPVRDGETFELRQWYFNTVNGWRKYHEINGQQTMAERNIQNNVNHIVRAWKQWKFQKANPPVGNTVA